MARRIIHIEPTDAQWAAIDYIFHGMTPFVAVINDENGQPTAGLYAERIVDDHTVQLFTIYPDGNYSYEELQGLGHGWARYGIDGRELGH